MCETEKEMLGVIVVFIFCIVVLITAVAVGENFYRNYTCNNLSEMTGKPTKWLWFDACYIEHNGKFQRYDEYVARSVTNEEGL